MTPLNLPTIDDFEPEVWDAFCYARKYKMHGDWYRLLRAYTNYRSYTSKVKAHLEQLVDEWLAAHPSWQGTHYYTERLLYEKMQRARESRRCNGHANAHLITPYRRSR